MFRFHLVVLSCVWPITTAVTTAFAAPPRKRALLVAVTHYDRGHEGDAPDLHTKPDVAPLQDILKNQFRFDEITVLESDKDTTHDAILHHFRSDLIDRTQPGDIIYFHYSGHGAQVEDPTHRKPNGMHECLVPSDYVSDYEYQQDPGRKGARARLPFGNYILDDNVRDLLNDLKAKQPANVTLSFDSCYSGTVTRGALPVRGLGFRRVYIPPELRQPAAPASRGAPAMATEEKAPGGLLDKDDPSRLGYAVISAVNSEQEEPEVDAGNGAMGLLSWALAQVLAKPSEGMTYRDLAEKLASLTTQRDPDSIPQVEGYLDREVLGTTTHPPQPFIPVRVEKENGRLLLSAGTLHGMTQGSRFDLYPAGTKAPTGTPLAEATVTAVEATVSGLALDPKYRGHVPLERLNNTRAFETEHQFTGDQLRVDVSALRDDPRGKEITAALREEGIPAEDQAIQVVESRGTGAAIWDVRLIQGKDLPAGAETRLGGQRPGPQDVVLLRQDGTPFAVVPEGPALAAELKQKLEGEARWRFLNSLPNPAAGSGMSVKVELVQAHPTSTDLQGYVTAVGEPTELTRSAGGQLELSEAGYIQLRVTNTGSRPAYISILDLRPDGTIGPVFPLPGMQEARSNLFPPNERQVLPIPYVFRLTAPYGVEVFKAIATDRPTDFSFVLSRDSARGLRGQLSPLQKFLQSATIGKRAVLVGAGPSEYAVDQITFEVKPSMPGNGATPAR